MCLVCVLPITTLLLLVCSIYTLQRHLRQSILLAAIVFGLLIASSIELLSIFTMLTLGGMCIAWSIPLVVLVIIFIRGNKTYTLQYKPQSTVFLNCLLIFIGFILIVTFAISIISPPNNYDSMTYHMARVMHWIQDKSVSHFPADYVAQLENNPWAEFAITTFQILTKGDYLANLVQWFCMLGSILGVTLIAEKLAASTREQIVAAAIVATIPMGILQSSSTQNDCVVAFWLVCGVYFGIVFNEKPSWLSAFAAGASLALAILTKGTAYLYAFPLSIWFAVASLKSNKLGSVKYFIFIAFIVVTLNLGHYARNYETFGNILSSGQIKYSNDNFGVASLISNTIRNTALEMSCPSAFMERVNSAIISGAIFLHRAIGLNINASETTWPGTTFSLSAYIHQDFAGNILHVFLICSAICIVCCDRQLRSTKHVMAYTTSLVLAYLLFSGYLKWQPWHNRLMLPLIILWSPLVAVSLSRVKPQWSVNILLCVMLFSAIPYLLFNDSRPLLSYYRQSILTSQREQLYFSDRPDLIPIYEDILCRLKEKNCYNVAMHTEIDAFEYPLWILLQKELSERARIEHVDVHNPSAKIPLSDFNYCAKILIDAGHRWHLSFVERQ